MIWPGSWQLPCMTSGDTCSLLTYLYYSTGMDRQLFLAGPYNRALRAQVQGLVCRRSEVLLLTGLQ